jgi:hypothetical protein
VHAGGRCIGLVSSTAFLLQVGLGKASWPRAGKENRNRRQCCIGLSGITRVSQILLVQERGWRRRTASMGKASESPCLTLSEVTPVCCCYTTTRVGKARGGTVLLYWLTASPVTLFVFGLRRGMLMPLRRPLRFVKPSPTPSSPLETTPLPRNDGRKALTVPAVAIRGCQAPCR